MRVLSVVLALVIVFTVTLVGAQAPQVADTELTAAVIIEQNVTFVVVVVKPEVLNDQQSADGVIQYLTPAFGDIPVVLMIQNEQGTPTYYGRPDIAEFLSKTPIESMPWKKYALKQVQR